MGTTYDAKSLELAEHFLGDLDLTAEQFGRHADRLAIDIQQAIEAYIDDMARVESEAAERANDPHERAAARARANDFEETDGKDWT